MSDAFMSANASLVGCVILWDILHILYLNACNLFLLRPILYAFRTGLALISLTMTCSCFNWKSLNPKFFFNAAAAHGYVFGATEGRLSGGLYIRLVTAQPIIQEQSTRTDFQARPCVLAPVQTHPSMPAVHLLRMIPNQSLPPYPLLEP